MYILYYLYLYILHTYIHTYMGLTKHITISEDEDKVLKEREISATSLFKAAIRQIQAREWFFDPNVEVDKGFLFKEVAKLQKLVDFYVGETNRLKGELAAAANLTTPQETKGII